MIRVQEEPFDAACEAEALTERRRGAIGALVAFTGLVRDFADGADPQARLTLEHYPGMTQKALRRLEAEARRRFDILDLTVIHRYGVLALGEPIVFVGVASAHRAEAFEAARFLIDRLKTEAPFWKLEEAKHARRWVEAKPADKEAAAQRR